MRKYFTSDWHLGEDRIGIGGEPNLFYRPFQSIQEQNQTIFNSFEISGFENGDELYHLGDVLFKNENDEISKFRKLREKYNKSKFNLIIGNYDEDKIPELCKIFDFLKSEDEIEFLGDKYYLNHYPVNCIDKEFSLTAHIHGLWKVQKNMINVGVDAWHFKLIPEDAIKFCRTACEKYYDKNVFPF